MAMIRLGMHITYYLKMRIKRCNHQQVLTTIEGIYYAFK